MLSARKSSSLNDAIGRKETAGKKEEEEDGDVLSVETRRNSFLDLHYSLGDLSEELRRKKYFNSKKTTPYTYSERHSLNELSPTAFEAA